MPFGETYASDSFVLKPFIKTVLAADFTSYKNPVVVLNPPFAVVQGWVRLEAEKYTLRILINGIDSTAAFTVSQVGKKVDFELINLGYSNPITIAFESSKKQPII
ncbi:MAG: hypothetical protein HGA42_00600 [Nostocales cyanobacterium W4_Combined_metabat2_030]|nr:hypothetical protein [Nostocales cyanobacterium W4_Combined_metabat2_030]